MRRPTLPALALAVSVALSACGSLLPDEPNIDISGSYVGRIVGSDGRSALLDVTVQEKDLRVTASVTSRDTGQSFTLTGTRSVYDASPVTVDTVAELGTGSACAGGFTERYQVRATFSRAGRTGSVGAQGYVNHQTCNAATGRYEDVTLNSGSLELTRR
ncbi:hypothetical protein DAERI_040095 [Deinococcus aerius]|uniref:Lipoprotein n=1 Tax=Deinococcus aerius TaxID=200253 RepID=A0A2I9DXC3_9DEIO|nr:hypothetical protein [Deinococcus aerius]GBF05335.1 hypothetical protein DAERI_040095 [Deinococcus aerius]